MVIKYILRLHWAIPFAVNPRRQTSTLVVQDLHALISLSSMGKMSINGFTNAKITFIDNTPKDVKVHLALVHLEGKALQWHTTFTKSLVFRAIPSWKEYSLMLIDRFGVVCNDPFAELMTLPEQNFVTEYHEAFDTIISRLELSEDYTLSCFMGGLKQEVQMMVRMFQSHIVRRAFSLAKM
jgi:hypothetical protein